MKTKRGFFGEGRVSEPKSSLRLQPLIKETLRLESRISGFLALHRAVTATSRYISQSSQDERFLWEISG